MRIPEKSDLALVRVLGYLSGDGRVEARREKGKRSIHYEVRFFPDNRHIATVFCEDFQERFKLRPRVYNTLLTEGCYTVRFRGKDVCQFLLSIGAFNHKSWRLPDFESNEEHIQWIKAFLDCEGYVNLKFKSIQIKSVNRMGLQQVYSKLTELGISSKLYGPLLQKNPKWTPYYMLEIRGKSALQTYRDRIGFNHPSKHERLMNL